MNEMQVVPTPATGLEKVDPAVAAAAEVSRSRIQAAYMMAAARPRNEADSRVKILEACKRKRFAEDAIYNKPIGNTSIRGPSVRYAETAIRLWGNIMAETFIVYDDANTRRVKVVVTDMETNAGHSKEIQLSKEVERKDSRGREVISERLNSRGKTVYTVVATEDELHNKQEALVSKAFRTLGLRLIPSDVTDEAMEICEEVQAGLASENPKDAINRLTTAFSGLGIQVADLEAYLDHPVAQCNTDEIKDLRQVFTAIKDGDSKWADYVRPLDSVEDQKDAHAEAMDRAAVEHPVGRPNPNPAVIDPDSDGRFDAFGADERPVPDDEL